MILSVYKGAYNWGVTIVMDVRRRNRDYTLLKGWPHIQRSQAIH